MVDNDPNAEGKEKENSEIKFTYFSTGSREFNAYGS